MDRTTAVREDLFNKFEIRFDEVRSNSPHSLIYLPMPTLCVQTLATFKQFMDDVQMQEETGYMRSLSRVRLTYPP